ncbi:sulfotransferase family protein [Streptomyces triticagri]|uniref:Sulfotransferase family protein n=1 Tax=Streptomyces triticagri TaxID=2293568 RepID=A0A372M2R2_9ACTN|nr:sulfotransferase family protein [Streptomyces triticagri]RFU85208.1 sulfotransferase family protein [Streptomyces triticagri]
MNTRQPTVIAMWSPPRCRSTAFERMMMERGDVSVLHEPFNILAVKGSYELDGKVYRDQTALFDAVLEHAGAADRPLYFKDTTDYRFDGLLADPRFVTAIRHTFIIRDPAEAIASHYALNPELTADEVGFGHCWEIFDLVREATGSTPAVVHADDLVRDPAGTAARYSALTGLPHLPHALSWETGGRREWQVYSDWHQDVASSTGIRTGSGDYAETVHTNARLADLHTSQLPYYERLLAHRISPAPAAADAPSQEATV